MLRHQLLQFLVQVQQRLVDSRVAVCGCKRLSILKHSALVFVSLFVTDEQSAGSLGRLCGGDVVRARAAEEEARVCWERVSLYDGRWEGMGFTVDQGEDVGVFDVGRHGGQSGRMGFLGAV